MNHIHESVGGHEDHGADAGGASPQLQQTIDGNQSIPRRFLFGVDCNVQPLQRSLSLSFPQQDAVASGEPPPRVVSPIYPKHPPSDGKPTHLSFQSGMITLDCNDFNRRLESWLEYV